MSKSDAPNKPPPMPASYYDFYKTNGEDTRTFTPGPSMTRQEFADECDINNLMKQYEGHDIGAIMRQVNPPSYVDFAEMPQDLLGYMELMKNAEAAFMTLPASVRREFDNSPVAFVDFASDRKNLDQMRTWGLAPPAEAPTAQEGAEPPPVVKASPEPPKAV